MVKFFVICGEGFKINRTAGLTTVLLFWNHRLGRVFPLARVLSFISGCSLLFSADLGRRVQFRHFLNSILASAIVVIGNECTILNRVTIGSNIGARDAELVIDNVSAGPRTPKVQTAPAEGA